MNKLHLAPSLLSADFSNLEKAVKQIEDNKGTVVHIDVMDGKFVESISFGIPVIKSVRKCTERIFDVHLMVDEPARTIELAADAPVADSSMAPSTSMCS